MSKVRDPAEVEVQTRTSASVPPRRWNVITGPVESFHEPAVRFGTN
jgi:hypothetical protein